MRLYLGIVENLPAGKQKKIITQIDELRQDLVEVDAVSDCPAIYNAEDYQPEFCRLVVAAMSRGFDERATAGAIGVTWATFEKWQADHPKFAESVDVGKNLNHLFWQKLAIKNMVFRPTGKQLNTKAYGINVAARFGWGAEKEDEKKQTRVLAFELNEPPSYKKEK